jgi:hypothetical protein
VNDKTKQHRQEVQQQAERIAFLKGVALGHTTAWLEAFAERSEVPVETLAEGLGALFHRQKGGSVLGPGSTVPELRRQTTPAPKGRPKMAVAVGAHSKPQVRTPGSGPAAYWAKMTPEERRAEMMRRARKRTDLVAKKMLKGKNKAA